MIKGKGKERENTIQVNKHAMLIYILETMLQRTRKASNSSPMTDN